jgi:RND family efflux transporter MFP subunit
MAEQNLALAKDKLDFKVRVNQMPDLESPFSQNDIKADQLEVRRLENALNQANLELDKLERFEHKRKLGDLDEKVEDGELDLKRAELEAKNQILIAETEEQANKRTYEMQKKKLDELRENEKKLTVTAERSGLVVYDTGRNPWDPTRTVIAKGEKVQPRQQIMVIPDMSSLQIKTRVYEAVVEQVKPGKAAFIRPDAKPGAVFTGTVDKVAPLPDSQNMWLNPGVKVYKVVVKFDKLEDSFKPGMTAEVEIILAELQDVLSVPIAAVFTEQGKTVCYRNSNGRTQKVEVEVGMMNDKRVEVKAGLAQGDEVLLARPSQADRAGSTTKPASSQPATGIVRAAGGAGSTTKPASSQPATGIVRAAGGADSTTKPASSQPTTAPSPVRSERAQP